MHVLVHRIITYLRISYLLQVVTLLEIAISSTVIYFMISHDWWSNGNRIYFILITLLVGPMPLFPQLDARSRFQDFKKARDQFYIHGFNRHIARPFIKSRCQRDAILVAAENTGYGKECKIFFHANGYKWFHVLPEFILDKPKILLSPCFWKTTFFASTYHSRFDWSKIATYQNNGTLLCLTGS